VALGIINPGVMEGNCGSTQEWRKDSLRVLCLLSTLRGADLKHFVHPFLLCARLGTRIHHENRKQEEEEEEMETIINSNAVITVAVSEALL
jgi:hypothetical protein